MYANDHPPPHFHVRTREGREALVVIENMSVLAGSIQRKALAEAMQWARDNLKALDLKWRELNR